MVHSLDAFACPLSWPFQAPEMTGALKKPSACSRSGSSKAAAQSRSGPRSQSSSGTPNPVFGRSISRELATEIYRALCNVDWFHEDGSRFGCTWRSAGATVAELRGEGEDYLDYYCSGNEGYVADSVSGPLAERGWTWRQMD